MAVTIMQGDSWPIYMSLTMKESGSALTPDMIEDLEIYVGTSLRYTYVSGGVRFDAGTKKWYIWPTQTETFSLEPDSYKPQFRVKYKNQEYVYVKGIPTSEKIIVVQFTSREVL